MKTKPNNSASASALRITFSIALIFVSAILLAMRGRGNPDTRQLSRHVACAEHRHDGYA